MIIHQEDRGELSVTRPKIHVVVVRMCGHLGPAAGAAVAAGLSRCLRTDWSTMYWDLWDLTNYHSDVRIRSVETLLKYKDSIMGLHACSKTRLVSMGISVASMALGMPVQTYAEKAFFDRALESALKG